MIAGLQRIDTGEVEMAGAVVERGNIMFHRKTGLLIWCFKIMPLWPHMTVKQNMEYGMRRRKVNGHDRSNTLIDSNRF